MECKEYSRVLLRWLSLFFRLKNFQNSCKNIVMKYRMHFAVILMLKITTHVPLAVKRTRGNWLKDKKKCTLQ